MKSKTVRLEPSFVTPKTDATAPMVPRASWRRGSSRRIAFSELTTTVFKHTNVAAAKKAETARYHSTKAILGAHKVRGAGHTKAFGKYA